MATTSLTSAERRFIQRCLMAGTPIDLVEYHLDMARFDLDEPDGHLHDTRRTVYTVAWERISAELAGEPWSRRTLTPRQARQAVERHGRV